MTNAAVAQMAEQITRNDQVGRSNRPGGTKLVLTAHQPCLMPWLGFFAKLAAADMFVVFDAVPHERHGFGNRTRIKTAQGVQWLTVPIRLERHLDVPLCEIEILTGSWKRKHLRGIELAYAKAPYFQTYYEPLQAIYEREWRYLAGFNRALLDWLLTCLGIQIPIICASEQGFEGSKSSLVLDMCLKLGATEYIFGAKGRDYADLAEFEGSGIKVWFQDYQHPIYPQLHGEFVPGLSILDLLMNVGPGSLKVLRG